MRTYEVSFICDGRRVVGSDCLHMVAGQVRTTASLNEQPPEGWGTVLMAGNGRQELCPRCFELWKEVQRQRMKCTETEIAAYRDRCADFDWNFDFIDDHSEWSVKRDEFQDLVLLAKRHPELRVIFDAARAGGKATA